MENASEKDDDNDPLSGVLAGIAQVALPLARMYLGPAASRIEQSERDPGAAERRVLLFAMHKLVVETGTLPAPGAAYEPHAGQFVTDEKGQAPALDLRHALAALRALSAWAAAGPRPITNDAAPNTVATAAYRMAEPPTAGDYQRGNVEALSTRALRATARARSYGAVAVEPRAVARPQASRVPSARGGCGCRAGASAYASRSSVAFSASARSFTGPGSSYVRSRAAVSADRKSKPSHCDCNGACGGRGCGCSGAESCLDCIPRGAVSPDTGQCGCPSCAPAPEVCMPWTPSCETRNRLRACLSDILCDLLRCVEEYLCSDATSNRERRVTLQRCLVDLLCKVLRCVREALCPAPLLPQPCPPPNDCLPCSYAVEESR